MATPSAAGGRRNQDEPDRARFEAADHPRIAQRNMRSGDEHDQSESDIGKKREGRVAGMQNVEAGAPEDRARGQLADDDRHGEPPRHRQQRSGQSQHHYQRQRLERHLHSVPSATGGHPRNLAG
ncbi:hypothetical protein [Gordonia kroppenstedtii]|uniref:hypothetical protein n=1 Tax=Jongsikchunia kroppenstedtii TaxID=1121721 RepID=UPI00036C42B8